MFTTSHRPVLAALTLVLTGAAGCATPTATAPPSVANADAGPGVTPREREALIAGFQTGPNPRIREFTAGELDALMRRSRADFLGEDAIVQIMTLAIALTSAGDEAFADALSRQTASKRDAMNSGALRSLWTRYGLRYPRTQALLPGD